MACLSIWMGEGAIIANKRQRIPSSSKSSQNEGKVSRKRRSRILEKILTAFRREIDESNGRQAAGRCIHRS